MSGDWDFIPLRSCAKWLSGGTPSTLNASYWDGEIPWISAASLTHFRIRGSDRRITRLGAENGTRIVPAGTVLFVVRGMSLKSEFRIGIAMRELAFGQDCKALIAHEGIDPMFLGYAIKGRTAAILRLVDEAGHGTGRLQTDLLEELVIGVPSLDEQRRITGVLGALDDKIEVERQKREHLDLATRVVGAHLIRDGATKWPRERLGDHFVTARGLSYTGAGLAERGSGVPLHNLNSVLEGGGYKFEGIKYYSGDFKERHVVRPGDLVVANTEQGFGELLIGFPAIVPSLFGSEGIFSHHLHLVTPLKTSCLSRCWLYVWLLDPANHDLVAGYANGTTVNMLPVSALEDPVVPVPPPERSRLLDEIVVPLLAEIEGTVKQTHHLAAVRDLLLPKLVSGQVRVHESYDPDDVLGTAAEEAGAAV